VLASHLRQPIDRWVRPLGRALGRTGISPNLITVVGVLVVTVGTVVFAGAGHLILGSLIVAGAEVLAIHYIDPLLSDVVPFLVLIAMLIVRPWGLFGTREELDRV